MGIRVHPHPWGEPFEPVLWRSNEELAPRSLPSDSGRTNRAVAKSEQYVRRCRAVSDMWDTATDLVIRGFTRDVQGVMGMKPLGCGYGPHVYQQGS
jgi:hypothetical protein